MKSYGVRPLCGALDSRSLSLSGKSYAGPKTRDRTKKS